MPIYHQHQQNEEVYIFIQGKGQVQVDGEVIEVQEGSIVRIAPNGERIWRNNSNEPLLYIVIQTRERSLTQYGLADAIVPGKSVTWPNEACNLVVHIAVSGTSHLRQKPSSCELKINMVGGTTTPSWSLLSV